MCPSQDTGLNDKTIVQVFQSYSAKRRDATGDIIWSGKYE